MEAVSKRHRGESVEELVARGLDKQLGELLTGLLALIALAAVTVPITSPDQMPRRWAMLAVLLLVTLVSREVLRRRGRVPAGAILCCGSWLLGSAGVVLWGGLASPSVWFYPPTILAAALFWSVRAAAVQGLLGGAVAIAATLGLFADLVPPTATTPRHGLVVMMSSLAVTALMVVHNDWTMRSLLRVTQANRQRLADLVELNPDAIVVVSVDGRIVEFNRGALDLTGRPMETTLGQPVAVALGDDIADLVRSVTPDERLGPREALLPRRDGAPIPVEVYASTLDDGELLVSLRDIRERKRAHHKKLELERRLRATARLEAIGRIAGGVAHDLNNLMTVVMGSTHLLGRATDEPTRRSQLDSISEATDRAVTLVRQLLASGGKQKLDLESRSLSTIVSGLELLLVQMITDDVDLRLELDDGEARALIDRGQLEQVVMNLVKNASDAMPSGGELVVRCRSEHLDEPLEGTHGTIGPGDVCILEVADEGMGMSDETLDRIFEPFFTSKASTGGTGLGLATVFGIVKQHGGLVTVRSTPGAGSTFGVVLPRDVSSRAPRAPVTVDATPAIEGEGRAILLVEDDALVRRATERALRGAGFEVLSASSAEDALLRIAERPANVDLMITDCVLPKVDGLELARQLTARGACPPILFVSGGARAPFELPEGAMFLPKPYDPERLLECVSELMTKP